MIRTITPITSPTNSAVVGPERPERLRDHILRRQRAPERAKAGIDDADPADEHVDRADNVIEGSVAGEAIERRAVVVALRGEPVEDLVNPCGRS